VIRVLVAEDQALLRGALCEILDRDPDLMVVAQCSRGDEVLDQARHHAPDVALLDIEMPGSSGLEAAEELVHHLPAVRILVLTVFGRPGYVHRAVDAGALGFLLKDAPPVELIRAIKRTAAGERVIDPALALNALERGRNPLTEREREVLALSRTEPNTAELASALHLTEGSVRNIISMSIQKLHANGRAQAALIAEENGWL